MSALSTIDLNQILQRNPITKKVYLGTYPACEIPKSRKKRYCFITNTDQHDEPGTHWTAWMVEGDNVEFLIVLDVLRTIFKCLMSLKNIFWVKKFHILL